MPDSPEKLEDILARVMRGRANGSEVPELKPRKCLTCGAVEEFTDKGSWIRHDLKKHGGPLPATAEELTAPARRARTEDDDFSAESYHARAASQRKLVRDE